MENKATLYKTARIATDPVLHTEFTIGEFVAVWFYRWTGTSNQYLVAKSRDGFQDAYDRCVIFDESKLSNFCL